MSEITAGGFPARPFNADRLRVPRAIRVGISGLFDAVRTLVLATAILSVQFLLAPIVAVVAAVIIMVCVATPVLAFSLLIEMSRLSAT